MSRKTDSARCKCCKARCSGGKAPSGSFAASFSAYIALPFATGWAGREINTAVFFVLAIMGLEVFGVILAGYASGSKWSLFGGMREAAQVVSYEVPLGLCVLVPVMLCGTMNLVTGGGSLGTIRLVTGSWAFAASASTWSKVPSCM